MKAAIVSSFPSATVTGRLYSGRPEIQITREMVDQSTLALRLREMLSTQSSAPATQPLWCSPKTYSVLSKLGVQGIVPMQSWVPQLDSIRSLDFSRLEARFLAGLTRTLPGLRPGGKYNMHLAAWDYLCVMSLPPETLRPTASEKLEATFKKLQEM